MGDMGWTSRMASEEAAMAEKYGACVVCGNEIDERDEDGSTAVSNGPGEPDIGAAHNRCLVADDPQALIGADHYGIDWNEPVGFA